MKKQFLLAGFAAAVLCASAMPAMGQTSAVINTPAVAATYSATAVGLVPAASATDFFTITGSATKTIEVTSIGCSGVSTAAATGNIVLVKRSTANSAGTSTTKTGVPHDSSLSAATATVRAYTANPTTGTLVGNLAADAITTSTAASSAVVAAPTVFKGADARLNYPLVLRGATQVLALNGNGASYSAGTTLNCTVTWVEK